MGTVYAAQHLVTEAEVAIKVLSPELAHDATVSARFLREARTSAALQHPNAIRVSDVLELPQGGAAIVMERLRGHTLSERMREAGRLSLGETARIWLPVLDALAEAHAKGIVHRDIKPSNILLHERGGEIIPKLLDFGIAKAAPRELGGETEHLTQTGSMLGTPSYMSPEQVSGERDVDAKADLWSVGVTLYESLSGHLPFDGENLGQIFSTILLRSPTPLRLLVPDLHANVSALVMSCLERERDARPDSCAAIAAVLREFESAPGAETLPVRDLPEQDWITAALDAEAAAMTETADAIPIPLTQTKAASPGRMRYGAIALLLMGGGALAWSLTGAEATRDSLAAPSDSPTAISLSAPQRVPAVPDVASAPLAAGRSADTNRTELDAGPGGDGGAGTRAEAVTHEPPAQPVVPPGRHVIRPRQHHPRAQAADAGAPTPSQPMGGLFHTL